MKLRNKIVPMGLGFIMAAMGPAAAYAASPEFSRTAEEWERLRDNVLEYDEIADLVHEYNTTVEANRVAYAKTRGKTVEEITQQYNQAAGKYGDEAFDAEDKLTEINAQLNQRLTEIQSDDTVDDGENDRLNYAKAEAGLVKDAQGLMNTYHQLLIQKELEENNKAYQEKLLQSASVKQGNGTAVAADVLSAQQAVHNSTAAIIKLDAQIEDTRQNLAIMTGWKASGNPEIQELPSLDLDRIAAMDPAADREKALANDYALQVENRRLNISWTQENKNLYTTNVKKLEESAKSNVDIGYQNVIQAKTAYEQAELALTVANNNYNTGARKLQLGMISQLQFEDLQYNQKNAETTYQLKNMELFQAIQNYDWLLTGLASS